jgi:hypothetical protein
MTVQHQELAAGRWKQLAFVEQMAHIGSEVERALNWHAKHHAAYAQQALERALELLDLTLGSVTSPARLKELTRAREALVDYFVGTNEWGSTPILWRSYFSCFTYAARRAY